MAGSLARVTPVSLGGLQELLEQDYGRAGTPVFLYSI